MDTLTQLKSSNSFQYEVEGLKFTSANPGINQRFGRLLLSLLVFGILFLLPSIQSPLHAESTTCIPDTVANGNGDPWSEECYLNDDCELQGNPCTSNDVKILSIFLADAMGNPIPPCNIGDPQTVLVWGVFNNTTGTSRYGIRTRTEAWLNGVFDSEFNACSFDVLVSGQTAVALLGAIDMTCGDELQFLNTWIAWNTDASQCSNPSGANYVDACNDYSPSKCFKNLNFVNFLTPTFTFFCQGATTTYSNVCFVSSVFGGTAPYTYSWDFGDSGTSTSANVCHTYLAVSGQFVATLTVTDAIGQSFAVKDTVDLDVLPCPTIFQAPPEVGCATQTTPIDCPATPVFIPPTVTDSCGGSITLTFSDVTTPGSCANTY